MKIKTDPRGFALFFTLIISIIMGLLIAGLIILTNTDILMGKNVKDISTCSYIAEAGAYKALTAINASTSTYGALAAGATSTIFTNDNVGTGQCTAGIQATGTDSFGKPYLLLKSIGTVSSTNKTVLMLVKPQYDSKFKFGAFAKNKILFSGNFTAVDSYDSSKGAYGGANIGTDGDIGVNSIAAEALDIGNGDVYGDAFIGPTGNVSTVIKTQAGAVLTGIKGVLPSPVSLPDVTIPDFSGPNISSSTTLSPGNFGELDLSGTKTVTLNAGSSNPGKFYFKSVELTGTSQITTIGNVEIYILEDLKAEGNGIVNSTGDTSKLTVYVEKHDENGDGIADNVVKLAGNGGFYGGVYAPDVPATVTGNGDIFGSIVGSTIDFAGQGKLHFDTKMSSGNGSVQKFVINSWKDI